MTKYNPKREDHRKWLAERIIKVILGYGYIIDFGSLANELTFVRKVNDYEIRVYTSIDKATGACRHSGSDALRVLCLEPKKLFEPRFSRNIHRRGTFDSIASRLAEALRIANWNAENPDKPRWNGSASPKRRKNGRIQKKIKKNKLFS